MAEGYKHTDESRKKMRESHKGQIPWNKGKKGVQIAWNKGLKGYLSGENHYNWQGGITILVRQIRNCFKYRQWRSDVYTRDNWICQGCNTKGGELNAHHIKEFSLILEEYNIETMEQAELCDELWNINNGITLCESCHKEIHKVKKDV